MNDRTESPATGADRVGDAPGSSNSPPRPGAERIARLAGELLHDLNDALATLSIQIDLAAMEARDGSATPATLERLRDSFDQLRQMVRDVFEEVVGHVVSPDLEFEPCEVARTAFDQWLPSAPSVHASFHCELQPTARVRGRASLLSRAVTNLLRNAARHARGEVRLRGRTEGTLAEAMLLITVDDDGPGVPDALRDTLFEPHVHGGHGGAGLGLSVVRWCAETMGGSVEHSGTSPLGGARFVLRVPLARRRTLTGAAPMRFSSGSLAGRIVAVVDEDGTLASSYAPMLRREGATALHFSSGSANVATLAALIASTRPDVVLLDLRAAGGTGSEIPPALRDTLPDLANRVLPFADLEAAEAGSGCLHRGSEWSEVRAALLGLLRP